MAATHQVRNDRANAVRTSQGQAAVRHDLWRSVLGRVAGSHHNLGLIGVRNQVHGTSHTLEDFSRDHVVGQVTLCTHL